MEDSANQTRLRILMTTDTVGGVWSYSMTLCKALLPLGVQFYLITTGAPMQPAQKEEAEALENVTLFETDFLLEWMNSPWESMDTSGSWLLGLEKELEPDIIHINGFVYGSLPWKAPVIIVAHSDVYSWWLSVKGEYPPAAWDEYFKRVSKGLEGTDYIVAPSNAVLKCIQEIYGATASAQVKYNGRSGDTFFPAQKESFIFSMGRLWDEAKNIQLLVDAAPHIPYPIRLAGDNSFAGNHCTTGATISYLGKLSTQEVATQLSTAMVYVLPAKFEPFGLSVLEAALSGCALILGNIDTLKEIWNDSAIYVDTDDARGLANTINNLMENEALRTHYAQKALEQAAKYTITAKAEQYLQVYRQLQQQKKRLLKQEIV